MDSPYFISIADSLKSVERPGYYATGGQYSMPLPSLSINSAPDVILGGSPLCDCQVKLIIESSTQAPFGRGEATIVDTSVRNTWQLCPTQFSIDNPEWEDELLELLDVVKSDLGCDATKNVTCELYKLLLYEPGGFFKRHRDTEKSEGMFGTLVIQLPSNYTGGQLAVYHRSKSMEFDFDGPAGYTNFHYAAFYADCQHEIKPVTKGHRLCLVYNLIYSGPGNRPAPANNQEIVSSLVSSMEEWNADVTSEGCPKMMTYLLEHQYCEASLSFQLLKNTDRAVADVLLEAKTKMQFDLYLGQVNISQNFAAGHDYGGYVTGELYEESVSADSLKSCDSNGWNISSIELDKEYFVPDDFMDDADPDEEEFEEATGNEGATVDKQYRWTALLLWPTRNRMVNVGLSETIDFLANDLASGSTDEDEMIGVAKDILRACHAKHTSSGSCRSLLQSVQKIGNVELISEALEVVALSVRAKHSTIKTLKSEIFAIGRKYGWSMLRSPLQAIFDKIPSSNIKEYCGLLYDILGSQPSEIQKDICHSLASAITSVLSGEEDTKFFSYGDTRGKDFLIPLFKCFVSLEYDEGLLSLVRAVCAKPNRYPVLDTVVPFCEELYEGNKSPHILELLSYCVSSLKASSSTVPDWSLPVKISCSCADCAVLIQFLRHPTEKQHRFRMAQKRRSHLESQLRQNYLYNSFSYDTERSGTPHTLVVTKTSYEKAVERNQKEKNVLVRLVALTGASSDSEPPVKRQKIET